ncbi:MAG: hypothetical protein IJY62_02180 [Clostridia bacterium]|nr:hypothetical protein [Clostridia bacterium]
MEKFKKFLVKILYLPVWLTVILPIVAAAALICSFLGIWNFALLDYLIYAFSAYALAVVSVRVPAIVKGTRRWVRSTKWGNRYFNDPHFRVRFSLNVSLIFNLAYAVFKIVSGVALSSWWVWTIGIYYALLAFMRIYLFRFTKRMFKRRTGEAEKNVGVEEARAEHLKEELEKYRFCAYMLLVTAFVLSGLVIMMVLKNEGYYYPGLFIYVAATYAFYSVTTAIYGLFKYRKILSPVLFAAKVVRFVTALVSLLALQTALLSEFGGEASYGRIFNALTGGAVCLLIAASGIYMIVQATKKIRGSTLCKTMEEE